MSGGLDQVRHLLERNVTQVRAQVAEAALASGRQPDDIRIIAVTKYVDAETTWLLAQCGLSDLGESRPQALWQKHQLLQELNATSAAPIAIRWHMIGHLQRNKIQRTLPLIDWLHSLDSLRLAEALNTEATKTQQRIQVLLEVNPSQDHSKTGLPMHEASATLSKLLAFECLDVKGLMAMSTDGADPTQARVEFERVRQLRDQLQSEFGNACELKELSMGMSGDFPQAIAAGCTMLRLGSIFFTGLS